MTMYHPFPLECFPEIRAFVSEYMENYNQERIYIKNIPIPEPLLAKLNSELNGYGLGDAWNFLCFKRRDFLNENLIVHVDYSNESNVVHSSIVFPVEGCEDTHMYWVDGSYDIRVLNLEDNSGVFARPMWKTAPITTTRVEISQMPMLIKVDVPHSATSRADGSYRTILSVRIKGNPTFEEVLAKISP